MQNTTREASKYIAKIESHWFRKIIRLTKYLKRPWLTLFVVTMLSLGLVISLIFGTYLVGVSLSKVGTFLETNSGKPFDEKAFNLLFWPIIGGMLGSFLASAIFYLLIIILIVKSSQDIGFRLRRELFNKLQKIPFSVLDTKQHGDLMSRLTNDVSAITTSISSSATFLFTGIIQVLFISIFLFLISPVIAAVVIILIPILFSFIIILLKKGQPYFTRQQNTIGDINTLAEEYYSGHKVIKSFNYVEESSKKFSIANYKNARASKTANFITGVIFPYNNFVNNFLVVVVIFLSAIFIVNDWSFNTVLPDLISPDPKLTALVVMSVFILFLRQLTSPISQIMSLIGQFQLIIAGSTRAFELVDAPNEKQEIISKKAFLLLKKYFIKEKLELYELFRTKKISLGDYEYQIDQINYLKEARPKNKDDNVCDLLEIKDAHVKFENINFSYEKGKQILKNVSFEALPGTSNAIVGPTGSGKTTIISLLVRFYNLDSGTIYIDNQDISKVFKQSLRQNVSMVLQDTFLFGESVRDNIKHGDPKATEKEIIHAAKMSNSWSFIEQLPQGLDTMISNDQSLSEGQKQLLAISRAFLSKAKIIILDEATSYVDTKTEKQIQEGMAKLMKGRTSFIIAHRLSTIKNCDKIIVLENGIVVEQGTHQELMKNNGLYLKLNSTCMVDEN